MFSVLLYPVRSARSFLLFDLSSAVQIYVSYTVFSRLNAGPRLNAGSVYKTPGQHCRFLNKRRVRLIGAPAFIPLSDGKQEFTERAAAFFNALEQATPVDENDPFADLEPDIYEEEPNEVVVFEDYHVYLKLK